MQKINLFLIDEQLDFCSPTGSLYVPGAEHDVERVCSLIKRIGHKLNDIQCTLDSHYSMHVANNTFWRDSSGNTPNPFTQVTYKDVECGKYIPVIPSLYKHALYYTGQLEKQGKYTLTLWPRHCIIGSSGHSLVPNLSKVIQDWELEFSAIAPMTTKGSNYKTEHYSVLMAEVPDASDSKTQLNTELIQALESCDSLLICGEALSHCLASSVRHLVENFSDDSIKKIVLLRDCTSSVPGFEALGEQFIKDMTHRGMQVSTSDKVLV